MINPGPHEKVDFTLTTEDKKRTSRFSYTVGKAGIPHLEMQCFGQPTSVSLVIWVNKVKVQSWMFSSAQPIINHVFHCYRVEKGDKIVLELKCVKYMRYVYYPELQGTLYVLWDEK